MAIGRSKGSRLEAVKVDRKPVKKTAKATEDTAQEKTSWTFLTNHAHVLFLLSQTSDLVLREVALRVGITERAVQRIIADLESEGFVERARVGRKNHYRIFTDLPLRHPIESHRTIGDLIALIGNNQSLRLKEKRS
jgi:hypothetical protein